MKNLRRSLFSVFAVPLALLVFSLPALAQGNTLTVRCADSGGSPVSGVKVMIQHMDTTKWSDKKSDGKGVADFNKLSDGVYRVLGRKEGLAPAFYEYVVLKGGAQQTAALGFQPGDATKKVYFEDQALSQKAYELMDQATKALMAGKFADAEKQYLVSIEINPSNPETHMNLALACLQQRKWEQGEGALKKTSSLAAALSSLPTPKGATGPNPYAQIRQRADELIAKIPGLRVRTDGDKALAERKFEEAAAKYQEAIKLESSDPDLYYNLALAQANGRKFDEANQAIDQAIQITQKSIQMAEEALAKIPEGPQRSQEAARVAEIKKTLGSYTDLKQRVADFRQNEILRKAQEFLTEGDKLFNGSDHAGALKKYQEAMAMIAGPKQAIVLAQMGKAYAQLNQSDQAIASFTKAMDLAPENPDYRKLLAEFYLKEKKYEEALNLYSDSKAAGSEPVDKTLFALGQKLAGQGNSEVAALAFERAIRANAENAEAYYELGMMFYYDKTNDKRARELLEKYVAIGKNADHVSNTKNVLVVLTKRMMKK